MIKDYFLEDIAHMTIYNSNIEKINNFDFGKGVSTRTLSCTYEDAWRYMPEDM